MRDCCVAGVFAVLGGLAARSWRNARSADPYVYSSPSSTWPSGPPRCAPACPEATCPRPWASFPGRSSTLPSAHSPLTPRQPHHDAGPAAARPGRAHPALERHRDTRRRAAGRTPGRCPRSRLHPARVHTCATRCPRRRAMGRRDPRSPHQPVRTLRPQGDSPLASRSRGDRPAHARSAASKIVVYETRSPVVRSIRSATWALLQEPRPAGRALSMSQFTLSASERRVGSAPSVVSSGIATPIPAICAPGQVPSSRPAPAPCAAGRARPRPRPRHVARPRRRPVPRAGHRGYARHGPRGRPGPPRASAAPVGCASASARYPPISAGCRAVGPFPGQRQIRRIQVRHHRAADEPQVRAQRPPCHPGQPGSAPGEPLATEGCSTTSGIGSRPSPIA